MYEAKPGDVGHVLLLYSGGLDTSAMILWIQEKYDAEVSTLTVDLGQGKDLNEVKKRAIELGAKKAIVIDAKEEFVQNFVKPSIMANGLYMGKYPMATALGRPLIAMKAVEVAEKIGADAIAHGCTGKGNDQVRIEATILTLNSGMKIIAPVRQFKLSRKEEIEIMKKHGFKVPNVHKRYSVDENMWGISFQGSELQNSANMASDQVFEDTKKFFPTFNKPEDAPDKPEIVEIEFKDGVPIALNGEEMSLVSLIQEVNKIGAKHGVGIIDYVESYIFGHKGREFYIAPAPTIIINAHKDLEHLLLPKQLLAEKFAWDFKWAYLIYHGLWFHKLRETLQEAIEKANKGLDGKVKVKLYKGSATSVARSSGKITKYFYGDKLGEVGFDELASAGFIELHSMEMKIQMG